MADPVFPVLTLQQGIFVAVSSAFIPQSFQCRIWIILCGREDLQSRLSQVIVAQIKLSQLDGPGVQG